MPLDPFGFRRLADGIASLRKQLAESQSSVLTAIGNPSWLGEPPAPKASAVATTVTIYSLLDTITSQLSSLTSQVSVLQSSVAAAAASTASTEAKILAIDEQNEAMLVAIDATLTSVAQVLGISVPVYVGIDIENVLTSPQKVPLNPGP